MALRGVVVHWLGCPLVQAAQAPQDDMQWDDGKVTDSQARLVGAETDDPGDTFMTLGRRAPRTVCVRR